jgi:hypothetical protein
VTDELIRAAVAAPVSVLLSFVLPAPAGRPIRALVIAVLVLAALAAWLHEWETWVIAAAATAAGTIPAAGLLQRPAVALASAAFALAVGIGLTDPDAAWHALEDVTRSRDVVLVVAGALVAVFIAGALIGRILHPFAERVRGETDTPGMENAGRYIGWLERSLLYGLVLLGSADAAALVIAAKSIARFPSFSEEKFAEYYLVGTLLSLLIAAATGFAVRAAMGLDPLS